MQGRTEILRSLQPLLSALPPPRPIFLLETQQLSWGCCEGTVLRCEGTVLPLQTLPSWGCCEGIVLPLQTLPSPPGCAGERRQSPRAHHSSVDGRGWRPV